MEPTHPDDPLPTTDHTPSASANTAANDPVKPKTQKRLLWMAFVGLLLVGVVCLWRTTRDFRVSFENYERLECGMAEGQVLLLLGQPATSSSKRSAPRWRP